MEEKERYSLEELFDNIDLYACCLAQDELIDKYINENYGDVPRIRGVRFMKIQEKTNKKDKLSRVFDKYVGTDTIYIHTRCGHCGFGFKGKRSNYKYYEADKWEEKYSDLFLEHINGDWDKTYCTHYFKAVKNDDYYKILKLLEEE